jgi:hypothetical protein
MLLSLSIIYGFIRFYKLYYKKNTGRGLQMLIFKARKIWIEPAMRIVEAKLGSSKT